MHESYHELCSMINLLIIINKILIKSIDHFGGFALVENTCSEVAKLGQTWWNMIQILYTVRKSLSYLIPPNQRYDTRNFFVFCINRIYITFRHVCPSFRSFQLIPARVSNWHKTAKSDLFTQQQVALEDLKDTC